MSLGRVHEAQGRAQDPRLHQERRPQNLDAEQPTGIWHIGIGFAFGALTLIGLAHIVGEGEEESWTDMRPIIDDALQSM